MSMRWLAPFFHPKMRVVLLLGFSSGLPYLLVGSTLGVWLKESGADIATVGMFAWVAIPYSFNFVWAPLVDHLPIPYLTGRLGRRRSWMLMSQLLLVLTLLGLSLADPQQSLGVIALIAVIAAFCSATQDIVIDAFRVEYLEEDQYQDGAALAVMGYRFGVLLASAGALSLADMPDWHWPDVYQLMAACMLVGIITGLSIKEPPQPSEPTLRGTQGWLRHAIAEPFIQFIQAHKAWPWILLLIFTYRLPDGFIGFISMSFYVEMGFTKTEIAGIVKLFGLVATLVGTILGAIFMRNFSLKTSLITFLLFQMVANLFFIGFELFGANIWYMMVTISLDNLSMGMITAAAITYMMRLCDIRYTATQYALLSSLASLASKTLAGAAGFVAESYGWPAMFALSAAMGLPALLVLFKLTIQEKTIT